MVVNEIFINQGIFSSGSHGVLGQVIRSNAKKIHAFLEK